MEKLKCEASWGRAASFSVHLWLKIAPEARPVAEMTAQNLTEPDTTPLRILLVEDNPVNQKLALKLLTKQGHQVTVAGNGKAAVEEFERSLFDLILMDVQMPEMDGLSATREIRRRELSRNTRVRIIAMTAQTMNGDRDSCFSAGMDGFLSKPIRLPELWFGNQRSGGDATPIPTLLRRPALDRSVPRFEKRFASDPACVIRRKK